MPDRTRSYQFWLVAACFLISGFAALLYETVWLRQFAILLGTSEQALVVVLASYMGGLALGSLVASRLVNRIRRPLLTYGLLEGGIAVSALCIPAGMVFVSQIQTAWLGGNPNPPDAGSFSQVVFCFGSAFGLILIPTALMGATLPLLARHVVTRDEELGPRIGLLYGINTAGAVIGTMIAAFVCLPTLGLYRTIWIGAGANLLVFVIVLGLVRRWTDTRAVSDDTDSQGQEPFQGQKPSTPKPVAAGKKKRGKSRRMAAAEEENLDSRYRWILGFASISGAVSFCYEILFTRMLGQMLGGSIYAFATMLSGFLLGIAIGGGLGSRLATSRRSAAKWFAYTQVAAAVCTLATFHLVNRMVVWPWDQWGGSSSMIVQVVASIAVLVPTSTCIGATFPLAIRVHAKDERAAASSSARVYFWNVLGGIGGAIATGLVILPWLQYHGAAAFAILINILIALGVVVVLRVDRVHLIAPLIAIVLLASRFPTTPDNVLRVSALTGQLTPGNVVYNHVGKSATVTVFDDRGTLIFQTNGLPESSLLPLGVGEIHSHGGYWLSALPSAVRPTCESMMIVGLGGGVVAELVPPSIQSIDILELEPAVVEANRTISGGRNHDPLSDPRVNVVINDGRNALALTDKKYDAIVSQPSHPWTAGASHLYSREFDQLVRDHLQPEGIFLQWMNCGFVDVELLKSMGATLLDVFPHVRLYEPTEEVLMFVASDKPMTPELHGTRIDGRTLADLNSEDRDIFQRLGVVTPTHLFSKLRLDEDELRELCRGAELVTDERNLLAMRASSVMRRDASEQVVSFLMNHSPLSRGIDVAKRLCPSFDLDVFLERNAEKNTDWVRRVGLPLLKDPAARDLVKAKLSRATGNSVDWVKRLKTAALEHPDNSDLAFHTLSNKLLGQDVSLTSQQVATIRDALSEDHQLIIDLLEKLVAGDLNAARSQDARLARWNVDDEAYEIAVRLRLPWRLESPPQERVFRCNEVIRIVDQSAAFANSGGLAFFRVSAAVRAGRPEIALGTAQTLALALTEAMEESDQQAAGAGVANLMRCYGVLRNESLFRSARPGHYRRTMRAVETALSSALP